MVMSKGRLTAIKLLFVFMVLVDLSWDALTVLLPIGVLSFLSSTVTNTAEAALFLVVLDDYYGNQIQVLVKWVMVAIVGIIAILFLLGGLVI